MLPFNDCKIEQVLARLWLVVASTNSSQLFTVRYYWQVFSQQAAGFVERCAGILDQKPTLMEVPDLPP